MKHWQKATQDELKKYVPDPDGEIERLQEQLKETQQELQIRINDNADMYAKLCNTLMQLEEANDVIKFFAASHIGKENKDGTCGFWICSGDVAFDNPLERIKDKMKYTCYDPRPAKKYLKKWGVK